MILNAEQSMVQEMMRNYAQNQLKPTAAHRDKTHEFPAQELKDLGALGAMGMTVPDEWGGAGMDYVSLVLAIEEIAAGDGAISTIVSVQNSLICGITLAYGQHASDTATITLEDCRIPLENLVGQEGEGYKIALSNLAAGRIGIAAQSVGMARAAFDAAVQYANERKAFGVELVQHQAVGFRLADMATQIEAAHQLVLHAATLKDAGLPCLKEASMAKLFASTMAERVCSDAIQIHGGYGYVSDFPVERIYRDVRVSQIYEGASDIQRLVIAREVAQV